MKKSTMKVLSFVMALLMIVGTLAVVPFSADEGVVTTTAANVEEECTKHTKGTLVQTVEPTCELYGYSTYLCSVCGEAFLTDITEPTYKHVWKEYGEVPATCETVGMTAGIKCEKCDAIKEGCEVIPKSHTIAYKIKDLDNCEEKVTFIAYCKTCGKEFTDAEAREDLDGTIYDGSLYNTTVKTVVDAKNHDLRANVVTLPTCTADGVAEIYCNDCSFTLAGVAIEKLGHTYEWKVKEATLFDNEQYYKQCKECGETEKSTSGTNKGKVKYYDSYNYIDDDGNTQTKRNANTNHAAILGESDDTVRTARAKIRELKVGATYSISYVFNGKTYTYTTVGECTVEHKNLDADYVFVFKNGSTEYKRYLYLASSNDKADGTVKGFDGDRDAFFTEYAKYRDIADLYKLTNCTNSLCSYSEKEVIFEKLGHVYDDYTFEIRTVLRDGEAPFEYRVPFNGYDNETYKCGEKPIEVKLCGMCYARALDDNAKRKDAAVAAAQEAKNAAVKEAAIEADKNAKLVLYAEEKHGSNNVAAAKDAAVNAAIEATAVAAAKDAAVDAAAKAAAVEAAKNALYLAYAEAKAAGNAEYATTLATAKANAVAAAQAAQEEALTDEQKEAIENAAAIGTLDNGDKSTALEGFDESAVEYTVDDLTEAEKAAAEATVDDTAVIAALTPEEKNAIKATLDVSAIETAAAIGILTDREKADALFDFDETNVAYNEDNPLTTDEIADAKATVGDITEANVEITSYLGGVQQHKYVSYCQNSECEGNEHVEFRGAEYYVCTNCDHAHWDVCINKDTSRGDEDGLCYMYFDATADDSDPHKTAIVPFAEVSGANSRHQVERNAEEFLMPATCVDKAYLYNKCKVCGAPVKIPGTETGDIDPDNHDWTVRKDTAIITLQAATCQAAGRRAIYCNRLDCNKYIIEEIPVDAEKGHALYTRDANGMTGISREYIIRNNLQLDPKDVKAETCTSNRIEKWYCDICKQIVYLEIEDTMLPKNVASNHALTSIVTVAAKPQNCVTGATYAYTYCKDCKTIITINGESVLPAAVDGEYYNIDEDLDETIIPSVGLLFTPDEWNKSFVEDNVDYEGVFGGDEAIKYEVIADAAGNPITYKLTSGGKGHRMSTIPGIDATCYNAGQKEKFYCVVCDYKDNADRNGAQIERINHKNAQTQAVKSGDEDRVITTWTFPGAAGVTNTKQQEIWALRAVDVRNSETVAGGKDYKIAYVPATCTEDGYIIGKYCPDCMKDMTLVLNADTNPKSEYFDLMAGSSPILLGEDLKPVYLLDENGDLIQEKDPTTGNLVYEIDGDGNPVLDEDGNQIPVYRVVTLPVGNIAGYKIHKTGHAANSEVMHTCSDANKCGEENYDYVIKRCPNCKEYLIDGFAKPAHKSHKVETYAADNEALGQKKDDAVIYTLYAITFDADGNPATYGVIYKNEENGKYYYNRTYNATANKYEYSSPFDYKDCKDTLYTAKKCIYGTNDWVDIETIEPIGHYTTKTDGTKEAISIKCTEFKAYVGLVCASCGLEVPDVIVEKGANGLDIQKYYSKAGLTISDAQIGTVYFEIKHNWAFPENDCEALNANVKACADCKINVINEKRGADILETIYHQYYNFTVARVNGKAGTKKLDVYNFQDYAFDDVVYPTFSTEGIGTITCTVCGKTSEVILPVVNAAATVSFDEQDTVIVGDTVTATVRISAKDFEFNTLKLYVWNDLDYLYLEDVEILYPFEAIDGVTANVDSNFDVIVRTPGVVHENVTINGENVPFLRLTYRVSDLANAYYNGTRYVGQRLNDRVDSTSNFDNVVLNSNSNVLYINSATITRLDENRKQIPAADIHGSFVVKTSTDLVRVVTAADGKQTTSPIDYDVLATYNPAYDVYTAAEIIPVIFGTKFTRQYDFNKDSRVDLDDYFALVDFVDSAKTIADFCTLTGYDVDAMLDTLDYSTYRSRTNVTVTNDAAVGSQVAFSAGTDADIAYGKAMIKREMANRSYDASITRAHKTIKEFAQNLIDTNTL